MTDQQSHPDEHQIELYLLGRLDDDAAEALEEHLFDCVECMHKLELSKRFHSAVKAVAEEDGWSEDQIGPSGVTTSGIHRLRPVVNIAAGLLIFALLPYLIWQNRVQHQSLQQMNEQLVQIGSQQPHQPWAITRLYQLSPERSAFGGSKPGIVIQAPRQDELTILVLAINGHSFRHYEAVLTGDQSLWRNEALMTDSAGRLTLALPSSYLAPGDYVLDIRGINEDGRRPQVASFSFRVDQEQAQ